MVRPSLAYVFKKCKEVRIFILLMDWIVKTLRMMINFDDARFLLSLALKAMQSFPGLQLCPYFMFDRVEVDLCKTYFLSIAFDIVTVD